MGFLQSDGGIVFVSFWGEMTVPTVISEERSDEESLIHH